MKEVTGEVSTKSKTPFAENTGEAGLRSSIEGVYNSMSLARHKPAFEAAIDDPSLKADRVISGKSGSCAEHEEKVRLASLSAAQSRPT
jgi:hypothetical protein